jgi:hypothetical protein
LTLPAPVTPVLFVPATALMESVLAVTPLLVIVNARPLASLIVPVVMFAFEVRIPGAYALAVEKRISVTALGARAGV